MFGYFRTTLENNMIKNVEIDKQTLGIMYEKNLNILFQDLNQIVSHAPIALNQLKNENLTIEKKMRGEFEKLESSKIALLDLKKVDEEKQKTFEVILARLDLLI